MEPFSKRELISTNNFNKFLTSTKKKNLSIDIRNYFAENEISEINATEVTNLIIDKYRFRSTKNVNDVLRKIFQEFIVNYIQKSDISNFDFIEVKKIASVLNIPEDLLKEISTPYTKERFINESHKILFNGMSVDENQSALDALQEKLLISDSDFQKIVDTSRIEFVQKAFNNYLSDGKYSPQEEIEFESLTKKLKFHPTFNSETLKQIEKAKNSWRLENEPLKKQNVNIK